jgi:copper resistance protein B
MKSLISLLATSLLALSAPLAAQTPEHSRHGNAQAGARKAPPRPAAKPKAKPAPKAPKAPAPSRPVPAQSDPSCPPEHAAMGHCTPKPAGSPKGKPTALLSLAGELRA